MIPEIGLMVGFYIIVRMVSFLTRRDARSESVLVKILAAIGALVALFVMMDLFLGGASRPSL